MITPYEKLKNTVEWKIIEKSIVELIDNKDLQLTTDMEYVIGYITKQIIENKFDKT